jgi:hypothetical protein
MASNRRRNAARKRVFEKSWFHQSIEHEAECDRVDYPRRLDWAVVILATVGTFQTPSKGREFSAAFNPEFLMAPLRNLSEDEIYLDLIDEMSPGVIKIAGPFLCVLMPMRFS